MLLLDTCALIWYTEDPKKLSRTAKSACDQITETGAFVSSISIWEIGLKIKNKKLDIGISITGFLQRLKILGTIQILPVDENVWIENLALDWNHKDPADRTIVASARLNRLPIVTSDINIRKFYSQTIW